MTGRMARRIPGRDGERGIALVIVLWTLVILALLTLGFTASSRTETRVAATGAEQVRLRALLRGGVELAAFAMADAQAGNADGKRPDDRAWRADGTAYPAEIDDGRLVIRIRDEAGRIDLNRADAETLQRLIAAVLKETPDAAPALAQAIMRQRGGDAARKATDDAQGSPPRAGRRDRGPSPLAAAQSAPGQPGNDASPQPPTGRRPFQSREELRLVPDMPRAVANALMPYVTVLSPSDKVSPAAADVPVLLALPGMTRGQAEAVVRARKARPAPTMERLAGMLPASLKDRLRTTTGPIYAMTIEAETQRGSRGRVEAVIWIGADADTFYRILDWRETGFDLPVMPESTEDKA